MDQDVAGYYDILHLTTVYVVLTVRLATLVTVAALLISTIRASVFVRSRFGHGMRQLVHRCGSLGLIAAFGTVAMVAMIAMLHLAYLDVNVWFMQLLESILGIAATSSADTIFPGILAAGQRCIATTCVSRKRVCSSPATFARFADKVSFAVAQVSRSCRSSSSTTCTRFADKISFAVAQGCRISCVLFGLELSRVLEKLCLKVGRDPFFD